MLHHKPLKINAISCKKGVTLIEIMVSLAIVGILASIGMPSFIEMIKKFRINAVRDDLLASIQLAKTDAIRRGLPIILIRTSTCGLTFTDAGDWRCGWQSVVDSNNNSEADAAELAAPLQVSTVPSGYVVSQTANGSQLIINKWGQAVGTKTFVISNTSDGLTGNATQTVCMMLGTRIFSKNGSAACS